MQASKPVRGFSADTEILTRSRSWQRFDQISTADEVATRTPDGEFHWEHPERVICERYDGDILSFSSRGMRLRVTPDHPVLYARNHAGNKEYVESAIGVAGRLTGRMIATSTWHVPDLRSWKVPTPAFGYATIESAALKMARKNRGMSRAELGRRIGISGSSVLRLERDRGRRHIATLRNVRAACKVLGLHEADVIHPDDLNEISGDDFAAFMGAYLSEGCVSFTTRGYPRIYISQYPKSKGWGPYLDLLTRMLGRVPAYDGRSWHFGHEGMSSYLLGCGDGAPNKRVPAEILSLSSRQLRIFWEFYRLGDGWTHSHGQALVTTSPVLAGQMQEVAQKIGLSASIHQRSGLSGSAIIKGRQIKAAHDRFDIFLRTTTHPMWTGLSKTPYSGTVYSVSTLNAFVYVRREGRAIWAGSA